VTLKLWQQVPLFLLPVPALVVGALLALGQF
jgi:hypothetical protein